MPGRQRAGGARRQGARPDPVRQDRAARRGDDGDGAPADPAAAARAIVLRHLTMGPRTRAQLERALATRRIPAEVSAEVLDRFEAVDLVDDEEFARQWVESRHAGRGLARRALAHELRQRGVAEDTLKDAVGQVTVDDELATARNLVRRKLAGLGSLDPERATRRLAGLLARKGYSGPVAWQAIREESAALAGGAVLDESALDGDLSDE